MNVCDHYTGVACVNGDCPNALADEYPEYGYENITCAECWKYKGCIDCAWCDTNLCVKNYKPKSRRMCDNYECPDCEFYVEGITEKLKDLLTESSYEVVESTLKKSHYLLHYNGKYPKELNCIRHYVNPNGIYSD